MKTIIKLTPAETAVVRAAIDRTMNILKSAQPSPDLKDVENKLESVIAKIDFAEIADAA
jgi:hypothetical protein